MYLLKGFLVYFFRPGASGLQAEALPGAPSPFQSPKGTSLSTHLVSSPHSVLCAGLNPPVLVRSRRQGLGDGHPPAPLPLSSVLWLETPTFS